MNNKSNFNQALWLAVSYTCSMLVGILSSVVLSRYFDKVQYGTYKQIIHIYTLLLTVFQAGLPAVFTYFLPRHSREEGKFIVKKVQRLLFVLGFAFSITLFCGSGLIARLLDNPELAVGLKIFSIFPLFTLPTFGVEGIYTVNKNTRFVAIYTITTRLVMLACIVLPVVFIKNDYRVALIGWGVASFVAFLIAVVAKNRAYSDVDSVELQGLTKAVFDYALPIMVSALVMMFFKFADQFFISRYSGVEAFAEYSNGHMTLPFAVMFITPVRAILTPIFSKANKEGNYDNAVKTLYNGMNQIAVLMIPLIVFAFCYAKEIMVFLYSGIYENSFVYFRIVVVFNFLEMFVFSGILSAIGKTKINMIFTLICAVLLWIIDFVLLKLFSVSPYVIAAAFVVMNSFAHYILPGIYLKRRENINVVNKSILLNIFKITIHCVVSGILVMFAINHFIGSVHLFWKLVVAILFYYGLLLASARIIKVNYLEAVLRFIKKK